MSSFRRRLMMAAAAASAKPYDAEVEWLQSDGRCYFDTGVLGGRPLDFELVLMQTENEAGTSSNIMGARISTSDTSLTDQIGTATNTAAVINYTYKGSTGQVSLTADTKTTISRVNRVLKKDNSTINTMPSGYWATDHSMLLFAVWNGATSSVAYGRDLTKICSLEMVYNSVKVRDFIPVRIGSVGYLYDKVNDVLYANLGSGTLIVGPDKS